MLVVDNRFNDPSIIKNFEHVDVNDKNLDNFGYVEKSGLPAVREHLTQKIHVDDGIDATKLVRNKRNMTFQTIIYSTYQIYL